MKMQNRILVMTIGLFMKTLTPEVLRKFADMVLDFAEEHVVGSASTVDDTLVLPVLEILRSAFNIPDNDS